MEWKLTDYDKKDVDGDYENTQHIEHRTKGQFPLLSTNEKVPLEPFQEAVQKDYWLGGDPRMTTTTGLHWVVERKRYGEGIGKHNKLRRQERLTDYLNI